MIKYLIPGIVNAISDTITISIIIKIYENNIINIFGNDIYKNLYKKCLRLKKLLSNNIFDELISYNKINKVPDNIFDLWCLEKLQLEQVMYLHSTFLSNTKLLITKHNTSIEQVECKLKNMKDELRVLYDYKHKLEKETDKSKQIVSILTTMV